MCLFSRRTTPDEPASRTRPDDQQPGEHCRNEPGEKLCQYQYTNGKTEDPKHWYTNGRNDRHTAVGGTATSDF